MYLACQSVPTTSSGSCIVYIVGALPTADEYFELSDSDCVPCTQNWNLLCSFKMTFVAGLDDLRALLLFCLGVMLSVYRACVTWLPCHAPHICPHSAEGCYNFAGQQPVLAAVCVLSSNGSRPPAML